VLLHFVKKAAMFYLTVGCISEVFEVVVEVCKEFSHHKTFLHSYVKMYLCSSGQQHLYKDYSYLLF